ncbi:MAG: TolC family protein, partial [Gammaproteobacteria bacterium]|nr:TolC family protein [Gammaproteobacteria bacterium]
AIGAPDTGEQARPVSFDTGSEPLTLARAVELSLTNNQSLAGLQARAEALGAVPTQAGALPDPTLGLNVLNLPTDSFNLDQEPMTQMQVSLSQSFPFPGKRGLKREAAEYEASAAAKTVLDKQLQVVAKVRGSWWQLVYLDRALEIIRQNQDLMRDFVEIAQTKYKVGKGLQQDVLLAQLELSRLLNRLLPLQGMRDASQADLNALMNIDPTQPIRLPSMPPDINLPELPPESTLLMQAVNARPLLAVERERIEAARTRLVLAKKEYYPDFKLGAAYGFRDASNPTGRDLPDLATFRLSINLPIYSGSKQSKAVDQRSNDYFQHKHAFNESLRTIQADITKNHALYQVSREQVSLYGTAIIPQARQTVSAMLSAYQVNKVDFLNVLNTQITLYNAQISYWEALSKAKQSLANLAASVGLEDLYE